jgi:hypothetical protein
MKITQKSLRSFNLGKEPSYNEEYNKAHEIHSMKEHSFLSEVQWAKSGMCRERITMKDINNHLEIFV